MFVFAVIYLLYYTFIKYICILFVGGMSVRMSCFVRERRDFNHSSMSMSLPFL